MLHRIAFPDPLEAVLFDLEGTLVDTRDLPYAATRDVLEEIGVRTDRPLPRWIGAGTEVRTWEILRERFELVPSVEELVARRTRKLVERLARVALHPMPGVEELLRQLEAHHVARVVLTGIPRAELAAILTAARLDRWFEARFSGHDDGQAHFPSTSVHVEAARHFGYDVRRCVAVEDSTLGVRAALAASMFVVAVPSEDPTASDYGRANVRVSSLRLLAPAFGAA